ncbi:DUF3253 domain-containing protein [Algoriphagus aquimarinus]|uniref:DUF3253 domain-containing protein n=1 Tax=Algoriphagus aquimarinus TaxID=237018 RepID=A0A5C7ARN4_9BACT|nr:DUF3253 domain-containing protein [Algoriphagus aquimarinus]TXE11378.1 hypothetical protein ESV85_10650 [Algoriphagus aquimarinus]
MEVLRTAILDMLRRKKAEPFSLSEVVQQMYPEDWEQFLEELNKVALELQDEGLLSIAYDKQQNSSDASTSSTLIISPPIKP